MSILYGYIGIAMEFIVPIIIGILSSLISSLIFLYFLRNKRPNVAISDKISKISRNGKNHYIIKIMNQNKRSIINIKISLSLVKSRVIAGGILPIYQKLPLKSNEIFEISEYDMKDKNATYAFRFVTDFDLENMWDDTKSYLRFRLICMDSFSNFSRVFNQFYYRKSNVIKEGEFKHGDSFDIV